MNPWALDQAGADDRGSEKVLVWQSIIGGRCITAIGGRFDAGESGNRVLQRGWYLGAGVVARHRRPGAAMTLLRVSDVSSLTFADPPVCVPSLASPEWGLVWISASRKGQSQLALPHFTEGPDRSDPRDLGHASSKTLLNLKGKDSAFPGDAGSFALGG